MMIRPIVAYGHSILTQQGSDVDPSYPGLDQVIDDMWETMRRAHGCGLAAAQIGLPLRLFVVDSRSTYEQLDTANRKIYFNETDKGITETFINARIVARSDQVWEDQEGCLSIPGLLQTVTRPWTIQVEYFNQEFQRRLQTFTGLTARMVQHEYDHTEGILFLNYLNPLTMQLMERKLRNIRQGKVRTDYPMRFG